MRELAGRTALVTGATGGIGHHVASRLAAEGMRVVVSARGEDALERLVRRIADAGGTAFAVPADLGEPGATEALASGAQAAAGPVDLLVNNAGIEGAAAYAELPPAVIERYLAVNVAAPMLLIRHLLPGMLERGRGHVVNVASLAGKGGVPFETPYATTKAALIGLTRSLRAEHRDGPVGFSAVCPGYVAGEGMYARMAADGLRAPRVLTPCRMRDVVDAVVRAVREDRPELLVARRPVRPLFILGEAFPGFVERFGAVTGIHAFQAALADRQRSGAT